MTAAPGVTRPAGATRATNAASVTMPGGQRYQLRGGPAFDPRELIRRSSVEARAVGGSIVAGVATDQLPAGPASLNQLTRAFAEQLDEVLEAGAVPVLMGSRHLAAAARARAFFTTAGVPQ